MPSTSRQLEGRYYVYAEYCPGDLYWGWWLYASHLPQNGNLDRSRYTWLRCDWQIDALRRSIGQKPLLNYRGNNLARMGHEFLAYASMGLVFDVSDNGRTFAHATECDTLLWDLHRQRQEQQLLAWKNAASSHGHYCQYDAGDGI